MTDPEPTGRLKVTVAVLTFRRPEELRRNLPEVLAQAESISAHAPTAEGAAWSVEVLVIDNDPAQSAREVLSAGQFDSVRKVVEPEPGLAAGRNRALDEAADSDLLAFIDDDERPEPRWLEALLETHQAHGAGVVRGGVKPEFAGEPDPWMAAGRFFHRAILPTGTVTHAAPTSNVLFDLRDVRRHGVRFDPRYGLTGGEDTLFTRTLDRAGVKIVWCRESIVFDRVPLDRMTRRWVLARALSHGNSHVFASMDLTEGGRRIIERSKAVAGGSGRALFGGVRWLAGRLSGALRHQALGQKMMYRGTGMALGGLGLEYREYARSRPGIRRLARRA